MFIGLLHNATARQRQDDAPVLPYPHPQTIDQALANEQVLSRPEDMDEDVRRAVIRRRQALARERRRHA